MPSFKITPLVGVSDDRLSAMQDYLVRTFRDAVTARTQQIDTNYQRWLDNYNAKPAQEVRSTPWVGASNFIPQLSRIHTDILSARINGVIMGTKPFWRPSTFLSNYKSKSMSALAKYMDMKCNYDLAFFPRIDEVILETCKVGTVTMKARWSQETEYVVSGTSQTPYEFNGLKLDVMPFYDFFPYPLTAPTIEETLVRHSRLRLTKEEVEYKKNSGLWDRAACDLLLAGGSGKPNTQENNAATQAGLALTVDTSRPITAVESDFKYELEDGKLINLICVFNPAVAGKAGILRVFHKYYSDPKVSMFIDWRIIPRTNLYYGIGCPEILEGAQEEQAQIHNDRRDASTIINTPSFKKKRYSLNNFSPASDYYPGKTWEVDNMDDVAPLQLNVTYNAMMEEENMVMSLAERSTGISAPMQGMGTGAAGKKGTYASQGTLALLAEGNRRLDIYIKRMRQPFNKLGKVIYTSYRDFGDRDELEQWGENGAAVLEAFSAGSNDPRFKNIFFDFSASDSGANKETDRSALTIMANTMAAYYQQVLSLAQAAASMPDGTPAKAVCLAVLDGAHDLAERLLTAFDISDRDNLVPDVRKLLGGGTPPAQPQAPQPSGAPAPTNDVSIPGLQALLQGSAAAPGAPLPGPPQ